jgi:WhiB family redox-sensing transcriptional regulator
MLIDMLDTLTQAAAATSWMDGALCAQADPEQWFPNPGEHSRAAKAICGGCPIRERCLEYALAEEIEFGVWGGLTATERAALQPLDLAA